MFIQYKRSKLIKNLILALLVLFVSCNEVAPLKHNKVGKIKIPSGEELTVYLAITEEEQVNGLSRIKDKDFYDNEAMLFYYQEDGERRFWMPETYFDLDIIFLNKDLYVLSIERSVPHFPKKGPENEVPRVKPTVARHVLEVKSSSAFSKKIKPGMMLEWVSLPSLSQIGSDTHSSQ